MRTPLKVDLELVTLPINNINYELASLWCSLSWSLYGLCCWFI